MTTTTTPQITIASLSWMPPRPTNAIGSPLLPTGKRGHPCTDNAMLTELRCHFPTITNTHLVTGARTVHIEIAKELRRLFRDHHCNLLGITDDRLTASNVNDPNNPTRYIDRARPDLLLTYLVGASVGVRAATRTTTTKCACGRPLHLSSRNYCKTCKAARNRVSGIARTTPVAAANNRAIPAPTHCDDATATGHRRHVEQVLIELDRPDAGPLRFPIVSALTDGSDLDQQILVIDDRLEHRTQRHLVDIDLLELARQTADSEFAAITAGTSHHPTALTTDVALAVNVPGGVVIWVGQANATNPLMNHSTHALPRLGIEIRKLLDPTTQARARDHLRAALVAAAGKLPIYDTAAVADAYELYERAKHQFPRSLRSVQELIGVYVPRTDEAWDVARKLHQSTPDLKLTRAIDSAAMLVDGTA